MQQVSPEEGSGKGGRTNGPGNGLLGLAKSVMASPRQSAASEKLGSQTSKPEVGSVQSSGQVMMFSFSLAPRDSQKPFPQTEPVSQTSPTPSPSVSALF